MEKKISIVIAAYNVEGYIRRCLDSLVNQTFQNIEIIVVNDGSTDRTEEIIQEYVEQYPERVFLHTKKNEGQGVARNTGLAIASGEYIGFVDSDDFVDSRMYELLYREAEEKECDLVTCGYYGCDDETGEITVYQTGYRGEFDQSIYENPKILRVNSPYPWNKLYKRELLERSGFQFAKGIIFEDLCAVFPLFLHAKKVGRVHEKLYYYIRGRKGGTISTFDERHAQIIDSLHIMNEAFRVEGKFEEFYDILLFFNIRHIYARFHEMEQYRDESFKDVFQERAFRHLDQYFPGWRESEEWKQFETGSDAVWEDDGEETNSGGTESEETQSSSLADGKTGRQKENPGRKKKRSEIFEQMVQEKKLEKGTALVECYHGNDLRGCGYFLAQALMEAGYRVYVSAADSAKAEQFAAQVAEIPGDWKFSDINSTEYLELMATAELLVNNRAFPGFYRKRKGQKFLFTDFLPEDRGQGRAVTYGARNMQGIQFSLAQADGILFPKELTNCFVPLLRQYGMEETGRKKGIFLPASCFLRPASGIFPDNKAVMRIAYAPSEKIFPGLKDAKDYLFLSNLKKKLNALDEGLKDGQKVYVCFPRIIRRRFQQNEWKHIEFFPEDVEPMAYMAGCDALIGEEGSEIYWMKALGRPVCRLECRGNDAVWSGGKRIDWSEMVPGGVESCQDMAGIFEWIARLAPAKLVGSEEGPDCLVELVEKGWKETKGLRSQRQAVYVPRFTHRCEFDRFMEKQDLKRTILFIEKGDYDDHMAAWMRCWEEAEYRIIIRSIVVRKWESRRIKYRLTTKDKLKEKRDRERYLGKE